MTIEEDKVAAAQGWELCHVYEMHEDKWKICILPPTMTGLVVNLAKANHPLPLKALRLISHYGKK
jgi:hypothetical protein